MRRILPFVLVLASGCHHYQYHLIDDNPKQPRTALQPYKELPSRTKVPLPLPVIEHSQAFDTAYIEFNDQGKMFDADCKTKPQCDLHQENEALNLIRTEKPGTVFLYVHGWNNNASENSADLTRFRAGLNWISRQPSLKAPFVGIYIGWRGGTLKGGVLGPFTFFTYWSRKEGARRMGLGDLTKVIDDLVVAAHENPGTRFFAMGHSFGARVLEGALQESVQFNSLFNALATGDQNYHPPIDMVLLVNPATDSMLTHKLVDRLSGSSAQGFVIHHPDWKPGMCERGRDDSPNRVCRPYPLMVEVSSEGDFPTGVAMPIANLVNWVPPMPLFAHPSARVRSAPFTASLRTHQVTQCRLSAGLGSLNDPCGEANELVEFDFPMLATGGNHWGRVERLVHHNPFVWVLKVKREISENHGDVWNVNVAALVLGIIDPNASRVYTPDMLKPSALPERQRPPSRLLDIPSKGENRPTLGPL